MRSMFSACSALTSLDVTNFNTANVTDMGYMFYNCSALTTIFCNDDWKSDVVRNSPDMFKNCTKLKGAVAYNQTKLDVSMANPTTGTMKFLLQDRTEMRQTLQISLMENRL